MRTTICEQYINFREERQVDLGKQIGEFSWVITSINYEKELYKLIIPENYRLILELRENKTKKRFKSFFLLERNNVLIYQEESLPPYTIFLDHDILESYFRFVDPRGYKEVEQEMETHKNIFEIYWCYVSVYVNNLNESFKIKQIKYKKMKQEIEYLKEHGLDIQWIGVKEKKKVEDNLNEKVE